MTTVPSDRSPLWILLAGIALIVLPGASLAERPAQGPRTPSGSRVSPPPPGKAAPRPALLAALPIRALAALPQRITLQGPYDESRVLIEANLDRGETRDVSSRVSLSVADPDVAAVDGDGIVRARRDGATTLIARLQGREIQVPVQVRGVTTAGPPRFLTDVLPVLTRAGCNQGACHGAASGKGGFKLSLLGYDPQADYDAITRWGGGRRVTRLQPERSLFLRKPALQIAHRGGKRFDVGSPEYRLLRDWITGGFPGPATSEPRVERLSVFPAVRTLTPGQSQRYLVRAHYSDSTQRDVTGQTLFTASDETVTAVDPNGTAKGVGPGEGAVVIRYQGLVATARVVSPFSGVRSQVLGVRRGHPLTPNTQHLTPNRIDALVDEKLAALGLEPSGRCTDADFVRRVYLDVIGLLPTPEEVRAFVWSRDPKKREKLIDALLERPEYVEFWTLKWGDLLRSSRRLLSERGMYAFHRWIRESVAENKPWDQFARELLLARGSGFTVGPANYFRAARKPEELAETTAQVFLGVRIQCARCHNHPFEKWTQNQYYQMAAFFARVKRKPGEGHDEQELYLAANGDIKHPRTGENVIPTALDAAPLPGDYSGDRRQALAAWLTDPDNPFFARSIANRVWRHFLGRGLVEPVDDLRLTNPPSNPALLDWLAQDLAQHGYDLKHLMRAIMRSQTYQRSSQPRRGSERDTKYYSHYPFKRLGAEQLLDALATATGVPEKFDGYPNGIRAAQLPDTGVPSYFLDLFGRPARQVTCECERATEPTVAQVLHLMNNTGINEKLAAKAGRVGSLLATDLPTRRIVDELYLASVSRFPTPAESRVAIQSLTAAPDRQRAAEDLLWALLNSKEFLFSH